MTMRGTFTLTLMLALAASLGFSQDTGTGGTSAASSNNNANAVVYIGGSSGRSYTSSYAGVVSSPGAYPGYAPENGACRLFWSPSERILSMDEIRSMANGAKLGKDKIHSTPVNSQAIPDNQDPIEFTQYNSQVPGPGGIFYTDDKTLASVVVQGKYLHTSEEALGVALLEAKRISHTSRVTVIECPEVESLTKGRSIGLGGSVAETTGAGAVATSTSAGFSFGTSRSGRQEHKIFYVYALNKGEVIAPWAKEEQEAKARAKNSPPSAPQPTPTPQPAPPPAPAKVDAPAPPPPAPAPVAAAAPAPIAACDIPQLTIYFEFNRSEVKPEYRENIRTMADWLKGHSATCKVQVQGHASKEASEHYNDPLGNDRARAVYNLLLAYGAPQSAMLEHASLGKDFPKGEFEKENRRVILVVQGPSSGR